MAKHERPGATDEWFTPPHVFDALGIEFDMDVAHPGRELVPWVPAREIITSDSLTQLWSGCVWMNAPFGGRNGLRPWLARFFDHGDGVALTPDRTSAPWWQEAAVQADAILFWAPKIRFIPGPGVKASSPAQGTTLMAAGSRGIKALRHAAQAGHGVLMVRGAA